MWEFELGLRRYFRKRCVLISMDRGNLNCFKNLSRCWVDIFFFKSESQWTACRDRTWVKSCRGIRAWIEKRVLMLLRWRRKIWGIPRIIPNWKGNNKTVHGVGIRILDEKILLEIEIMGTWLGYTWVINIGIWNLERRRVEILKSKAHMECFGSKQAVTTNHGQIKSENCRIHGVGEKNWYLRVSMWC